MEWDVKRCSFTNVIVINCTAIADNCVWTIAHSQKSASIAPTNCTKTCMTCVFKTFTCGWGSDPEPVDNLWCYQMLQSAWNLHPIPHFLDASAVEPSVQHSILVPTLVYKTQRRCFIQCTCEKHGLCCTNTSDVYVCFVQTDVLCLFSLNRPIFCAGHAFSFRVGGLGFFLGDMTNWQYQ